MSKPSRALIVRAYQKDSVYLQKLENTLLKLLAPFIANKYRYEAIEVVKVITKFIYYMGSTSQCLQTLGEEYAGLIAVQRSKKDGLIVPSLLALNLYSTIQSFSTVLGRTLINAVIKYLQHYRSFTKDRLSHLRSTLVTLLESMNTLNTALFYLLGNGYQAAQRILGINYVTVYANSEDHFSTSLFKIIGWINLIRSLNNIRIVLYELCMNPFEPKESPPKNQLFLRHMAISRCSLCLEDPCRDPTAITCGHIFCWDCIIDATRREPQCPLCRIKCHPSRLIYLQNI